MPIPPPRRPLPVRSSGDDDDREDDLRRPLPNMRGAPPVPPQRGKGTAILQVILVVVLMVSALIYMLWQPDALPNSPAEIDRIRSFARMNPIPTSAKEIKILQPDESPDGSLGIMFTATEPVVESWLQISPGTSGVKAEFKPGNVLVYSINPNPLDPDARHAEVRWQRNENRVWLAVSAVPLSLKKGL